MYCHDDQLEYKGLASIYRLTAPNHSDTITNFFYNYAGVSNRNRRVGFTKRVNDSRTTTSIIDSWKVT